MIWLCYSRTTQDDSWYFVIIFLLLYTRKTICDASCSNGCCSLNKLIEIKADLLNYIPSHIKFETSKIEIPFEMFEQCLWSREHIESILVDRCKLYILDSGRNQTNIVTVPVKQIDTSVYEYVKQIKKTQVKEA
eukprot:773413_1